MSTHTYVTHLEWSGSTGQGYRTYSRTHRATGRPMPAAAPATGRRSGDEDLPAAGAPDGRAPDWVALSADAAFRGDAGLLNPEQLLVMAASSCQLLSFLAVAARHGVDVVAYTDRARGTMPVDAPLRVTLVELEPLIGVAPGTDVGLVRNLVELAHDECCVARSLTADVVVRPTVVAA